MVPATPPEMVRRVVFLGTPALAVTPLRALHEAGFEIPLVVSRADKRRGRGSSLHPSPVKAAALELGIPVTTDVDDVLEVEADLGVVVAFGRLIKPHVLAQLPMVNLHFSLLPRWRGAAPVERALLAGDAETGVCLMALEEGLDTGGIYREVSTPIEASDTLASLRGRLVEMGTTLLLEALTDGLGPAAPQLGEPVYAAKVHPDELHLDFTRPARELLRTIRLGRAWAQFRGKRLRVWDAEVIDLEVDEDLRAGCFVGDRDPGDGHRSGVAVATGDGILELIEVQPEGKGRMAAEAWQNGAQPTADDLLS